MSQRFFAFSRIHAARLSPFVVSFALSACGGGANQADTTISAQALAQVDPTSNDAVAGTQSAATDGTTRSAATITGSDVASNAPADDRSTAQSVDSAAGTGVDDGTAGSVTVVASTTDIGQAHEATRGTVKAADVTPLTGYFVDSEIGSDNNAGTQSFPFKTFKNLAGHKLQAGQGIYLHCGGLWRDTLSLNATQLINGSAIGAYGTNCANNPPRVTGANAFSGNWTRHADTGIWSRPLPIGTQKITRLFVDGVPMHTAQWPDDVNGVTTYAQAATNSATSRVAFSLSSADQVTLSGKDLIGATVHMKTEPWLIETSSVASYTGGRITLPRNLQYPMVSSYGFALQDKTWMLSVPGEFVHDVASNTLYLIPPPAVDQAGVNSSIVEGAVRDNAAQIGFAKGLTISGIQFDMSVLDGLVLPDAPNAVVSGIISAHNGRSGLRISQYRVALATADKSANITGSTFADNFQYGVDGTWGVRAALTNSTVTDTGTIGWLGNTFAGVSLGDGSTTDGNLVERSAYIAIRYSGTAGSVVSNNDINGFCLRLSDCGAIYTWNGPKAESRTANQTSSVTNNRIGPSVALDAYPIAGVYLDEHTMGTNVRNNTVAGGPYGIFVQNASNNVVDGNKLWLNSIACLWISAAESDMDSLKNNRFSNNQLTPVSAASGTYPALPKFNTAYAIQYWTVQPDLGAITTTLSNQFINNQIMQLQSGSAPVVITKTASATTVYTPAQWHVITSHDIASAPAVFELVNANLDAEQVVGGDFSSGMAGWTTWYAPPTTGTIKMDTHTGCVATCALFSTDDDRDLLYGQAMSLSAGSLYVAKYTAGFNSSAAVVPPFMTLATAPFSSVLGSDGQSFITKFTGANGDVLNTETYFHASGNVGARINLKIYTPNTTVAFDNVSVRRIKGYAITKPSDWSAIVQVPNNATTSVTCTKLGWPSTCTVMDESGAAIAMPATFAAGASKLLLRADSPARL